MILSEGGEQRMAAEATSDAHPPASAQCAGQRGDVAGVRPQPRDAYRGTALLDDAAAEPLYAADPYIHQHRARSILCVPLLTQAKLTGALYLENNLAARVFSPSRIAVLRLVASQAAISLENARLYRDVAEREARIRRLVEANIIGIAVWSADGDILEANDAFLRMVGYERADLISGHVRWGDPTPPDMQQDTDRAAAALIQTGACRRWRRNTSARTAAGSRSSSASRRSSLAGGTVSPLSWI